MISVVAVMSLFVIILFVSISDLNNEIKFPNWVTFSFVCCSVRRKPADSSSDSDGDFVDDKATPAAGELTHCSA